MRGRSVHVVATVLAAIGVAIIGGWWIAADERGGRRSRPATTVTADEAAKVAARVVRELEAGRMAVPVVHCKLATPRQRYWCGSARRLTAAVVAAEILTPPSGSRRTGSCLVRDEEGDLWLIDTVGRCFL
jgi:hypothetical protein